MSELLDIREQLLVENKNKMDELYLGNNKVVVAVEWPVAEGIDQVTAYENAEKDYRNMITSYNQQVEAVKAGFDNVPVVSVNLGGVAWLMALAYGCELIKVGGRINAAPLYSEIEETKNLDKRDEIYNYGLYPEIIKRIKELQRRYGNIMIGITDNQSPIDVATCLINSETAMTAMFTSKELLHRVLKIITESMIEINSYQENIISNFAGYSNGRYLPRGMHVSDDDAAFLSPEKYREFALPYINFLAKEFGGIEYHCCMGFEQNLEVMASAQNFIGFDPQVDYNSIDKIINIIEKNKGVWHVYNYPWDKKDDRQETDLETFKRIINRTDGKSSLRITVFADNKTKALKLAEQVKDYALQKGRIL